MKHLYRISLLLNLAFIATFGYSYGKNYFYPQEKTVQPAPQINNITVVSADTDDKAKSSDYETDTLNDGNNESDANQPFASDSIYNEETNLGAADLSITVDTSSANTITTCDTIYEIETYNDQSEEADLTEEVIPEQYIGKTRKELENIMALYSQSPALSDIEKGFASMELKSFSPEKIVVVKNYYTNLKNEDFYLMVEDNYINVYYSDLKTVYMHTDIQLTSLPDNIQQEILDKKYIKTEEELFNFLESYSS